MSLIDSISYYLPEECIDISSLEGSRKDWNISATIKKTGVKKIWRSAPDQTTVDLAEKSAEPLIADLTPEEQPDALIFCTQTPDFQLPHCAAILQERLSLSTRTLTFDINLGCSGYVYGLGVAYGLLNASLCKKVLLVTAESYSKIINQNDKKTSLLFSDAASASLMVDSTNPVFTFGTDGSRHENIIFPHSGIDRAKNNKEHFACEANDNGCFEMDGSGVYMFTMGTIAEEITAFIKKSNMSIDDIDHFIFHQGSFIVLDSLHRKLKIPSEKMIIDLEEVGNAASSSIPITLKRAEECGRIQRGDRLCLFGFGIGLSWAGSILNY